MFENKDRWWHIRKVWHRFRKCRYSRWESVTELLHWWWRIFPLSPWSRMARHLLWLEWKLAERELTEIEKHLRKVTGEQTPLYGLAKEVEKYLTKPNTEGKP